MFKILGREMICSEDELVIAWKGENYYRACGELVRHIPDGGDTSCVKRKGHPTYIHEDYDGALSYEPTPANPKSHQSATQAYPVLETERVVKAKPRDPRRK